MFLTGQLAMHSFFSAKHMFAMVPTNRVVQNKKKLKEYLCIYTVKQDPHCLVHWCDKANSEMHTRQADLFIIILS